LFDIDGKCLEQPGEPAGNTFYQRIRQTAYPCVEAGDLIFAYLGPGEPPPFPRFAWFDVPDTHRLVAKVYHDCNYLQANEGNLDQVHLSFLHRLPSSEVGNPVKGSNKQHYALLAADVAPKIETETTRFGFREYVSRRVPGDEGEYLKIEAFVLPNLAVFPGGNGVDGHSGHWHVPIDDASHWKYVIVFRKNGPLDKVAQQQSLFGDSLGSDFHLRQNAENRYLQDREQMKKHPFVAGFGRPFMVHDSWASESLGQIADRTTEHLSATDKSVILMRRVMLDAIKGLQRDDVAPTITSDPDGNVDDIVSYAEVVPSGTSGPAHFEQKLESNHKRAVFKG
jgi:phthalate 4,5-dioxygenase